MKQVKTDMENSAVTVARMAIDILHNHGVRQTVISPGSRNTPLIIAANRHPDMECINIIDERSAAFIALGIAEISGNPVALICTSGTALLNYAPAIAEAYYRHIPLIAISADRPMEWIDQDDSQTLRQFEALSNYVKGSYNIPTGESGNNLWYANRMLNDAMLTALNGFRSPVHINIQLSEPLGIIKSCKNDRFRTIEMVSPRPDLTVAQARKLGCELASPLKIMIIAGNHQPDKRLNSALGKLSRLPNFIIFTESIANLHNSDFIQRIDMTLSGMTETEKCDLAPDCVITLGGALVSRHIKQYLRDIAPKAHWHVGYTHTTVDCFKSLTKRINMDPGVFFQQLASAMQPHTQQSNYSHCWHTIYDRALSTHQAYLSHTPWSDLKAMDLITKLTPKGWNVQYSNGTSIRYGQLFATGRQHRYDCNRGVSGIDGCTSTAIGAALAYKAGTTLLITGDMSARYDVGILGCGIIPPRFKMIVLNNGGGGIFRFIQSTKELDEREDMMCMAQISYSFEKISEAFGLNYFKAYSIEELEMKFKEFAAEKESPCILEIFTPPTESAKILTDYFLRTNTYRN